MLKTVLAAALSNLRPSAMAATGRSLHGLAKQQAPTFGPLPQLHQAALKPCRPVVLACSACSDQPSTSGAHRQHWQFPAAWSASARHVSTRADKVDFKRVYRKPRLQPVAAAASDFYAPDTTFASLGLDEDVVAALNRAGFTQPSRIQADSAGPLQEGRNIVIAAETGSGKTLAYIAPIASLLLRLKRRLATTDKPWQYHALVLCPNQALCNQILNVIHSLKTEDGKPLVTGAFVNSSTPPPFENPDFILATPGGLNSFLDGAGRMYGALWTEDGLQGRVKHVVLDEADLLMSDAYSKAVNQVLQMLKSGDRRRVEAKISEELGVDETIFRRLPRDMQMAAWSGGSQALLDAGFRIDHPPPSDTQFGPYWRRQYVFAAATMPVATYMDVGRLIEKFLPNVEWVSSDALHTSKAAVTHSWVEVDDSTWYDALEKAIKTDEDYLAGKAKTLVFAKDVATAEHVSKQLESMQVKHVVYHKARPTAEAQEALATMQQEQLCVMVCTDAAARGIDIQDVTHVVQADFADNTIAFIHRIGRTARAAKAGKVTSLYREHNKALVDVLQSFVAEGKPLEAAFSRSRSFSKKMDKKGGVFVPRGLSAGEYLRGEEPPEAKRAQGSKSKKKGIRRDLAARAGSGESSR